MRLTDVQVCVLGGGITGTLTACLLRDEGLDVVIVDRTGAAMQAASRWNEGKIHLGFTYTGVEDLATARLMLEGAAAFEPVLEEVTGSPLPAEWWTEPVVYLVDERSIFPPELLWSRARATAALIADTATARPTLARHVSHTPLITRLEVGDAMRQTVQSGFVAAWRTAERAIAPGPLAQRVRDTVSGRRIPVVPAEVRAVDAAVNRWAVRLGEGDTITATAVVNCLWESRHAIDRQTCRATRSSPEVTIRYRAGIFALRSSAWRAVAPSTRILGKFGDITPYGNGDLYLAWYPAGLIARSDDGAPPPFPPLDHDALRQATLAGLGLPTCLAAGVNEHCEIRGGYVVAHGRGDISEPCSTLHERSRPDAVELSPGYVSVDTGKYSLGPLMAHRAAALVAKRIGSR